MRTPKGTTLTFDTPADLYQYIKEHNHGYVRQIKAFARPLFDQISQMYPDAGIMAERFWLYCHGYTDRPKCGCGSYLRFVNVIEGYKSSCKPCYVKHRFENSHMETTRKNQETSQRPTCANPGCGKPVATKKNGLWSEICGLGCRGQFNSLISREKARATMMENLGVEHACLSPEVLEKRRQTMVERYGAEHAMHVPEFKRRQQETLISKYGSVSPWSKPGGSQESVDKAAAKYGYPAGQFTNVSQIPEVHAKKLESLYRAETYTFPSGQTTQVQGYEARFFDMVTPVLGESAITAKPRSVPYFYQQNRWYHPDAEVCGHLIEVKSDYTIRAEHEMNVAKSEGVAQWGGSLTFCVMIGDQVNYMMVNPQWVNLKRSLESAGIKYVEFFQVGDFISGLFLPDHDRAYTLRDPIFLREELTPVDFESALSEAFSDIGAEHWAILPGDLTEESISDLIEELLTPDI